MLKLLQFPVIFHKSIIADPSTTSGSSTSTTPTPTTSLNFKLKLQSKKMDKRLPLYLQQTRDQLLKKFQEIKLLEDERLHDATVRQIESKWSVNEGVKGFEIKRNRYMNILPWDRTRVKLNVAPGFSDYINASYVHLDLTKDWEQSEVANYISSQGPTFNTTNHFWQMVLQNSVSENVVVCMVTPLEEHGVTKCFKYWCDNKDDYVMFKGPKEGFEYDLRLKCIDATLTDIEGVFYTTLELQSITPGTQQVVSHRIIHHLYYDQWTDFSKPDDWKSIYQLTKLSRGLNDDANPIFVHCSAGVGRTGTYITLDYLFNCIKDYTNSQGKDLIQSIIQVLRTHRMMMVQSQEQFLFIYETLRNFLLSG